MKAIKASAPGRYGIVGNPSDIYGGVVVSCSVAERATCLLSFDGRSRLPEDLTLWHAATARFPLDGASVSWESDIPRSSGLAGSTALLAATLACVLVARRQAPDLESGAGRMAFAELLRDVERRETGVVCGYQDAVMTVFGGLQRMSFAGKHPAVEGGPAATMRPLDAPLPFLLVTTGVERLSGSVHGPMRERWLSGDREVVRGMERISRLGELGARALEQGDLAALAEAMAENHAIIASLGGSGAPVDELVGACLECGAMAAKLAGAGLGGTVIALSEDLDGLERRLRERGYARFARPAVTPGLRVEDCP